MESRRLRVAYKNRKACVKRKTMELSTLCDVKACTIIFGPDGDVETWPENSSDVKSIINTYKNYAKKSCKNKEAKSNDDFLDGLSRDALKELLGAIDLKIEVASRRAELLKMKNEKNRASFQDEETTAEQAEVILPIDEGDFINPLMQFHGGEVNSMQMYCSPLDEVIMLGSSMFPKQGVSDYENIDQGFDYWDPKDAWIWN